MKKDQAKALSDHCRDCKSQCCRYVAMELDRPTGKRDYDHLRWYLRHEKMHVFISDDNKWYLEFETHCRSLGEHGECLEYQTRPRICREHGENTNTACEYMSEEPPHKFRFSNVTELEHWLDGKGIDWRWKKRR